MSEVKRYGHIGYLVNASDKLIELYPDMTVYVKAADFDRVTAERDALAQNLKFAEEGYQSFSEENDKLQQSLTESHQREAALQALLTAADERVDAAIALITRILFCAEPQPSIATGYLHDILAALKPAEGDGDE